MLIRVTLSRIRYRVTPRFAISTEISRYMDYIVVDDANSNTYRL